jgi:hypothetical protein
MASASIASCVIIINPPPPPVPTPLPLTCSPGTGAPTAHLIFSTRIERTTVNMATEYEQFFVDAGLALAGAGVQPTVAVMVRADERPLQPAMVGGWGCQLDSPALLKPSDVIRYYSEQDRASTAAPSGCATDNLVELGSKLTEAVTSYPPGLNGTSGLGAFHQRPDVVVVVHLDALERKAGFDDSVCSSAKALLETGPASDVLWLDYAGADPEVTQVVHWFVASDEGIDDTTFYDRCREYEGVPTGVFDNLQPSAKFLYTPLEQAISSSDQRTAVLPICQMLASQHVEFLVDQAIGVGEELGLSPNADEIRKVIAGGIEGILQQQIPEGVDPESFGSLRGNGG